MTHIVEQLSEFDESLLDTGELGGARLDLAHGALGGVGSSSAQELLGLISASVTSSNTSQNSLLARRERSLLPPRRRGPSR